MKKIILDTNFLMIPIKFRIDIFSEIHRICDFAYKLCVYEATIDELKKLLETQKGKDKKAALFALKMAKMKFSLLKGEGYVDQLILDNADKNTIVATLDIPLKKALLGRDIPVIIMRQKQYLMFAPPIEIK